MVKGTHRSYFLILFYSCLYVPAEARKSQRLCRQVGRRHPSPGTMSLPCPERLSGFHCELERDPGHNVPCRALPCPPPRPLPTSQWPAAPGLGPGDTSFTHPSAVSASHPRFYPQGPSPVYHRCFFC